MENKIAYLPQEVFLVDDTLRRNVALGVPDADINDEKFTESLKKAQLEELLRDLPRGADTMLGERGTRLSGGQAPKNCPCSSLLSRTKYLSNG